MTKDDGITIVSNRGPVSFVESADGFETKRGAGGLSGAIDPVARRLGQNAVWIAAATSDTDRRALHAGAADDLSETLGYRFRLLDIEPGLYGRYYDDVSNRMLWFANHCLWDEIDEPHFSIDAWRDAYQEVNEMFARVAAQESSPNALVLFQDYHLSTAPARLHDLRDDVTSLHFTHSSFCTMDNGLSRLPEPIAKETIRGMLGADLVGFHVDRWKDNFLDCCRSLDIDVDVVTSSVMHADRRVWVRSYPIPIDAADLRQRAAATATEEWVGRLRAWAGDRKIVARVDRSEPSKNIVRGFEAFGHILDEDPKLREEVAFIACTYPSRETMPEYRAYGEKIRAVVGEVNDRHPDSIALFMEDDFDRSLATQIVYDVLLVNPIMDGMNLVAKEGPALNRNDGVLVLSSGAGAFGELAEYAVPIDDPLDVGATAVAIREGLALGAADRATRAAALRDLVSTRTPSDWIEPQLEDLQRIRTGEPPATGA